MYRHFRSRLGPPFCGQENAGTAPNGYPNDGLLDIRFSYGGRNVPAQQLEYVATPDARSPFIPMSINRCDVSGDVDDFGGWCANTPLELERTTVGTSGGYAAPGYVLSPNGEEIYLYAFK